jgi:hypothetical protein
MGTVDYTLTSTGISATYDPYYNGGATGAHVYYSCSKPAGNEAPGQYPIVENYSGSGNKGPFTMTSTGTFPSCLGGFYLMFHVSVGC